MSAFLTRCCSSLFCDYGLLFWAEQRVPSGIAAVMLATIPLFHGAVGNHFSAHAAPHHSPRPRRSCRHRGSAGAGEQLAECWRRRRSTDRARSRSSSPRISWSIASALSRKLPLPSSKVMSSGAQMFAGGLLLALAAAALGEFRDFHPRPSRAEPGSPCST